MKKNIVILLTVLIVISYLSVPGAAGIFPANSYSILFQRMIAALILLSIVISKGNRAVLSSMIEINRSTMQLMRIIIVSAVFIVPFLYLQNDYDPVSAKVFSIAWTLPLIIFYCLISGIYFILYELAIRGIFLDALKKNYSVPIAVLLNMVVYTMMHVPKGIPETVACIPFGLLLCIATIRTQSVLPAIIMHLFLGIALESSIIYHTNFKIPEP